MRFEVDSDMQVSFHDAGTSPLVFMPDVDWSRFKARNIVDAY